METGEQKDLAITPDQVEAQAFSEPGFISRTKKPVQKAKKPAKERYEGQKNIKRLHDGEEAKRKKASEPTPTILNSSELFVDAFQKIVSSENPGAIFPKAGAMQGEYESATRMTDILRLERCLVEEVVLGWMQYSARQFRVKRVRRTISVAMMRDTWDGYRRLKPSIRTGPAVQSPVAAVEGDSIGDSMRNTFAAGPRQAAVWSSCSLWGVVLTSNWLVPFGDASPEIRTSLEAHMGNAIGLKDVRDVFSATKRWEGATSKFGMGLSDWAGKFADIIAKVGPISAYPPKADDVGRVEAFVGGLRKRSTR